MIESIVNIAQIDEGMAVGGGEFMGLEETVPGPVELPVEPQSRTEAAQRLDVRRIDL